MSRWEDEKQKKKRRNAILLFCGTLVVLGIIIGGIILIISNLFELSEQERECFDRANIMQELVEEQGGITEEVRTQYDQFIEDCSFMLDMEQQIRDNPELHDGTRTELEIEINS